MAVDRKIGHTILHAVWYSRSRLMLHHIFNTTLQHTSVCCNVVTYKAVLGYKRVCHTNQSTWLQGHKSANQLRSHWRARLHGKHSFPLSLPPPRHFFPSVCFISNHEAIWKRKQGKMHLFTHSSKSKGRGGGSKGSEIWIKVGRR